MIDCQLIPHDPQTSSIISSKLHLVADKVGIEIRLQDENFDSYPPDILFLVHGTPEANLTSRQVTHYSKFTAIIMLSRASLTSRERMRLKFPIHSILTIGCPQLIFARAMIRAMNRKNLEFPLDSQAACRKLEENLKTIDILQILG